MYRVQRFFDRESTPYLMRGRLRLLMRVRTATRNLDLQLAIATLRLSRQVNARATNPEQSNTTPATVTARKLLEANSSRMVHHLIVYAPLEANDWPAAQSKELSSGV